MSSGVKVQVAKVKSALASRQEIINSRVQTCELAH